VRTCRFCGRSFEGRADAKFCTNACKQAAYRQRIRNKAAESVAKCQDGCELSVTGDAVRLVPMPKRWSRKASVSVAWDDGHGWQETG
jgi:hypothetical protein